LQLSGDRPTAELLRIAVLCNDAHLDTQTKAATAIPWKSHSCALDYTRD
jgi:Ca2+-transporting ATPase